MYLYAVTVSVCVCASVYQSRERMGGWDPRPLAQCCPVCPPEVGRGTTTHQKLEVHLSRLSVVYLKCYLFTWDAQYLLQE